jgi:hypothetical protein
VAHGRACVCACAIGAICGTWKSMHVCVRVCDWCDLWHMEEHACVPWCRHTVHTPSIQGPQQLIPGPIRLSALQPTLDCTLDCTLPPTAKHSPLTHAPLPPPPPKQHPQHRPRAAGAGDSRCEGGGGGGWCTPATEQTDEGEAGGVGVGGEGAEATASHGAREHARGGRGGRGGTCGDVVTW